MNHLLDDDDLRQQQSEREVTLSTAAIVGIFFGLVLLCGFFFALGYNLHKPASAIASDTATEPAAPATPGLFDRFKPRAGSPDTASAGAATPPRSTATVGAPPTAAPSPAGSPPPAPAPTTPAGHEEAAPTPAAAPPAASKPRNEPAPAAAAAAPPSPAVTPGGAFVVQVAAVSHQEDADLLVNALRQKGYSVASRTEPQDKLFHIQVGPFATHKEADQMRQRLLGDGYNAIVK